MIFDLAVTMSGLALMVGFVVTRHRGDRAAIDDLLGLLPVAPTFDPAPTGGGDSAEAVELEGLAGRAKDLADDVLRRVDQTHALGRALEQARIPMHPAEFLIVTGAAGLGVGTLLLALTGSVVLVVLGPLAAGMVSFRLVRRRVTKRRKAVEAQLPDALSLVASSLSAGHTFLRSIQMMCEEAG